MLRIKQIGSAVHLISYLILSRWDSQGALASLDGNGEYDTSVKRIIELSMMGQFGDELRKAFMTIELQQ